MCAAQPIIIEEINVLAHPTLSHLSAMGLHGMAKAFADAETPPLGSHVNVRGSTYYH